VAVALGLVIAVGLLAAAAGLGQAPTDRSPAASPLLASERDLPDEFVPPTNLGVLYLELGRPRDALAAAGRALARAEGPRRIRVLVLEAQAQDALGDRAAARTTLERALSESAALPEASRPQGYTRKAERLLAQMGGGAQP
jgi:tetratricopeptide (TPR) repeat protein